MYRQVGGKNACDRVLDAVIRYAKKKVDVYSVELIVLGIAKGISMFVVSDRYQFAQLSFVVPFGYVPFCSKPTMHDMVSITIRLGYLHVSEQTCK